jgi:hypothetical protein
VTTGSSALLILQTGENGRTSPGDGTSQPCFRPHTAYLPHPHLELVAAT